MLMLEALKDHPFCGKSKRKGDKYPAKPSDANLMVLLGLAKYADGEEQTRAPVEMVTQVQHVDPAVIVPATEEHEPVSNEQETVSNDAPRELSMVEINITGDDQATIEVVGAEEQGTAAPDTSAEPIKRGPGRPRGSYKTRVLKAEE